MAVNDSVDPGAWLAKQIEAGDPDLLRSMVKTTAEALMSAEADSLCGASYGERSSERTKQRNGYRTRAWDTRAGTGDLDIPKLPGVVLPRLAAGTASPGRALGPACGSCTLP